MQQPSEAQRAWTFRVLGIETGTAPVRALAPVLKAIASVEDAQAAADEQISALQAALRNHDDAALQRIAEYGLHGISGAVRVPLQAAILELKSASRAPEPAMLRKVADAAGRYAEVLRNDRRVQACDGNPFGVRVTLARTLVPPLQRLRKALAAAGQGD
jgi:hypothetical protein